MSFGSKSMKLVSFLTKRFSTTNAMSCRAFSLLTKTTNDLTKPYSVKFSADLKTELKHEHDQLMKVFPDFINDLTSNVSSAYDDDVAKYFGDALRYNVPTGLNNRALTTVLAYKNMTDEKHQTQEELHAIRLLGWCAELIHGSFIITDDIVDESQVRRNNPCWYKLKNVGWTAANDAIMIENGVYIILKKYFQHLPSYVNLIELFHKTTMVTAIGQSIDCYSARNGIETFSMKAHKYASFYKNSHLGFYAPIVLPMIFKGQTDQNMLNQIKMICFDIGHFYQSQNDYFDFFDETHVLRKPGTDIEDGRCTWLAVMATEKASAQQKEVLMKCYGKRDEESIQKVRQVYNEMDFPTLFKAYKKETYSQIQNQIHRTSDPVPRNILQHTLDLTFN